MRLILIAVGTLAIGVHLCLDFVVYQDMQEKIRILRQEKVKLEAQVYFHQEMVKKNLSKGAKHANTKLPLLKKRSN